MAYFRPIRAPPTAELRIISLRCATGPTSFTTFRHDRTVSTSRRSRVEFFGVQTLKRRARRVILRMSPPWTGWAQSDGGGGGGEDGDDDEG